MDAEVFAEDNDLKGFEYAGLFFHFRLKQRHTGLYEIKLERIPAIQLILLSGPKRASFGRHFHTSEDPAKYPHELFVMLHGTISLYLENTSGDNQELLLEAGGVVAIPNNVWHSAVVLSEEALFQEFRSCLRTEDSSEKGTIDCSLNDFRGLCCE